MKKYIAIFLFLFTWQSSVFAEIAKVSDIDQRLYYPQDMSLKDLYLEIKIDGLSELIKQRLDNPLIKDVIFKVYWLFPGKVSIEVDGIKGFEELKTELKMMVAEKLDFIVPEKIGQKFRSYNFKRTKEGVELDDESGDKLITKVIMQLEDGELLKGVKITGAGINTQIEYDSSVKRWATNKYSFDKVEIKSIQGDRISVKEDLIDYIVVQGYGFPSKIKTTQKSEAKGSKEKAQIATVTYVFDKYKVNEGEALKYFNTKR